MKHFGACNNCDWKSAEFDDPMDAFEAIREHGRQYPGHVKHAERLPSRDCDTCVDRVANE